MGSTLVRPWFDYRSSNTIAFLSFFTRLDQTILYRQACSLQLLIIILGSTGSILLQQSIRENQIGRPKQIETTGSSKSGDVLRTKISAMITPGFLLVLLNFNFPNFDQPLTSHSRKVQVHNRKTKAPMKMPRFGPHQLGTFYVIIASQPQEYC